jgi:hypothetical protein
MVQTLRVTERTGKDGVLHVSIPLGTPEADFEVMLVVQPRATDPSPSGHDKPGWPPDYFDLAGSIDDETFLRPPQGELPKPVEMT